MKSSTVIYLIVGLLLLGGGGVAVYNMTRGLRNNNPGNIRKNATQWQGLAPADQQTDDDFFVFSAPVWGIRAMAHTLNTYMTKYGLNTIRGIISRWAPPTENDTESYIRAVVKDIGVADDEVLSVSDLPALVTAIIKHENGLQPYSAELIHQAVLA